MGYMCIVGAFPQHIREELGCGAERRISLKTQDIAKARLLRDTYEQGDDDQWALLTVGEAEKARRTFEAAAKRATALGYSYRPAAQVIDDSRDDELFDRLKTALSSSGEKLTVAAALGAQEMPDMTFSQAYEFYLEKIAPNDLRDKSPEQRKNWLSPRNRAVANFIGLIGDIPIGRINRAHATTFFDFWRERIAPSDGVPTHSAAAGNKDLGCVRTILKDYCKYHASMPQTRLRV